MNTRMKARRELEMDLRRALAGEQFELYYQPLVVLETNAVNGFEALLRWNHPMRGLVSPADFIPIAEETGLIVPLGEWVLKAACAEAVNWPEHIKVAVNLSPAQLNCRNLVSMVTAALQESGMPPRKLQLEITETVLLQNRSFIQDLSNGAEPLAIVNAVAGRQMPQYDLNGRGRGDAAADGRVAGDRLHRDARLSLQPCPTGP